MLNNNDILIGQKLYVLNIYIENLGDLGTNCLNEIREDFLNIFVKWFIELDEELRCFKIIILKIYFNI